MNDQFLETVLNLPIADLGFTSEFRLKTELLGFHTLGEMLAHRPVELCKLPGFSLRMRNEYIAFLEKQRLGSYINA